jgi:hypothetical protein
MKLDPAEYACPDHHADLTSQVRDALDEDDGTPLAYRRGLLPGKKSGPRPFQVIVTCPGPAGGGQPHELACAGTWAR